MEDKKSKQQIQDIHLSGLVMKENWRLMAGYRIKLFFSETLIDNFIIVYIEWSFT